jgi:hypothetical protein
MVASARGLVVVGWTTLVDMWALIRAMVGILAYLAARVAVVYKLGVGSGGTTHCCHVDDVIGCNTDSLDVGFVHVSYRAILLPVSASAAVVAETCRGAGSAWRSVVFRGAVVVVSKPAFLMLLRHVRLTARPSTFVLVIRWQIVTLVQHTRHVPVVEFIFRVQLGSTWLGVVDRWDI